MIHARTLAACLAMTGLAAAGCHEDASSGAGSVPASLPVRIAAAPPGAAAALAPPALAAALARAGGAAASVDDRGAPTFLWAIGARAIHAAQPGATRAQLGHAHLARFAGAWGAQDALGSVELDRVHELRAGGAVIMFRQRVDGVDVVPGRASVLVRDDGSLVAIGGGLNPAAIADKSGQRRFVLDARAALATALGHTHGGFDARALRDAGRAGGWQAFTVNPGGALALAQPARVRRVMYAGAGVGLEPAYQIEAFAGPPDDTDADARRWIVSARDGRVLADQSLRADDVAYRVWADADGERRPYDGPHADFTPHPSGVPDRSAPAFVPPNLVTMGGFNSAPGGGSDRWLLDTATESTGNNADVYADLGGGDGFTAGTDFRATATAPGVFDRAYDTSAGPLVSQDQGMAAMMHAFYVVNWLHDWWYDSGFDEAAGNAQTDNFGRGGADGDAMRLEAQDNAQGGSRNNANMSTPLDGSAPRMQIFLWSGASTRSLDVTSLGQLASGTANFGPQSFALTGQVVLADDATDTASDACEPLVNNVAGQIVLLDRGGCTFASKALIAQNAGAVGVLLANNAAGAGPNNMTGNDPAVTIPVMSVSLEDGVALKAELQQGAVTATLTREASVERDGSLDSGVVAHEWGHYFHHRLAECGSAQCGGMSEGWGDFIAMHLAVREGDALDGSYAAAIYSTASFGDNGYFGIRRVPYSINPANNALSFRHISNGEALPTSHPMAGGGASNAEVHNAGEIWASMLFEAHIALLAQSTGPSPTRTFTQAQRAMGDYVVAGLELQGTDATFTEARDGILAAAAAASADDLGTLAAAFARRGAGTCAVSPARNSSDLVGVVEDDGVHPRLLVPGAVLVDSGDDCDGDGALDAGEGMVLEVEIVNAGPIAMTDTTVRVSTTATGVAFPDGATVVVPSLGAFERTVLSIPVRAGELAPRSVVELAVEAANADACVTSVTTVTATLGEVDEVAASSASDDVEALSTPWQRSGEGAEQLWARVASAPDAHAWVGAGAGFGSDTALASPALEVSATEPFTITVTHRYEFEASGGTFWDGGVIELSTDDGASWQDLSTFVEPGYGGTLTDESGNALGLRAAFVDRSPSWPLPDTVTYDLGTALAGQTVRVRFRIGTDQAVSGFGWELDDLRFGGIDNTPFPTLVDDASSCDDVGPDAGTEPDAGGPAVEGGDGGCCGAGGGGASGPMLLLGAVLLGLRPRRRRRLR